MNPHTHRTIYNRSRGCLMAVAETAKSSGKAGGGARPRSKSKSKTTTCRKARSALCSGSMCLQANQGEGYSLPFLQIQFNSALSRSQYEGYAASQLGTDPNLCFAKFRVSPQMFAASQVNKIIADLPASKAADELAKQPGMGWINDIKNDPALKDKVSWKKIDEAHKNWSYDKTTMTPEMAGLVTIALAVATGGTGAGLVGATAGSAGAAAASAAFTSLVTQATIGLINNGGDLSKTLEQMGSSESIRGLVTSMATAAAVSYVNSMDFMKEMTTGPNGLPVKFADLEFTQKLGVSVANSATGAVTRTALNGGSLGDALVQSIGNGLTTALAAQGANALHLSPDQQGDLMAQVGNKLGHALIGCAAAKANSAGNNCQAGAMGAVIGETAAELLGKSQSEVDAMSKEEKQAYESGLVNTTKLISASIAAAAGLDPNAAAVASANAVENNFLKLALKVLATGVSAGVAIVKPFIDIMENKTQTKTSGQMESELLEWAAKGANGTPPYTQSQISALRQAELNSISNAAINAEIKIYSPTGVLGTIANPQKLIDKAATMDQAPTPFEKTKTINGK